MFLGGTEAKGYGAYLFHHWRFLPDGAPNPDFTLNQAPYDRAQVLLANPDFGCGSSRERAPKAVRGFGFRVVVAPSFGGIFLNNCFRNGSVPVELPIEQVRRDRRPGEPRRGDGAPAGTGGGRRMASAAPSAAPAMGLRGLNARWF